MVKTVLVIDDSDDFRQTISDILVDQDFDIFEASCPSEAFKVLKKEKVDLILCDLNMPFTNDKSSDEFIRGNRVGIDTIRELGWVFPHTPIICISAATKIEAEEAAKHLGDLPMLPKPIAPKELLAHIQRSMDIVYHHCEQ
jgi:CheY-like chemotaxis protein